MDIPYKQILKETVCVTAKTLIPGAGPIIEITQGVRTHRTLEDQRKQIELIRNQSDTLNSNIIEYIEQNELRAQKMESMLINLMSVLSDTDIGPEEAMAAQRDWGVTFGGPIFWGEGAILNSPYLEDLRENPFDFGVPLQDVATSELQGFHFLSDQVAGGILQIEPARFLALLRSNRAKVPFKIYGTENRLWARVKSATDFDDNLFPDILNAVILTQKVNRRRARQFTWEGNLPLVSPQIADLIRMRDNFALDIEALKAGTHTILQAASYQIDEACIEKNSAKDYLNAIAIDIHIKELVHDIVTSKPAFKLSEILRLCPELDTASANELILAINHVIDSEHSFESMSREFENQKNDRVKAFERMLSETCDALSKAETGDLHNIFIIAFGSEPEKYPNDELKILLPELKTRGYSLSENQLIDEVELFLENCKDRSAWNKASGSNNVESLKTYYKSFPKGLHAVEAKNRVAAIQKALSEEQARVNQLQLVEKSRHKEQADWTVAQTANTIDSYKKYISMHPTSTNSHTARSKITTKSIWEIVLGIGCLMVFAPFILICVVLIFFVVLVL